MAQALVSHHNGDKPEGATKKINGHRYIIEQTFKFVE